MAGGPWEISLISNASNSNLARYTDSFLYCVLYSLWTVTIKGISDGCCRQRREQTTLVWTGMLLERIGQGLVLNGGLLIDRWWGGGKAKEGDGTRNSPVHIIVCTTLGLPARGLLYQSHNYRFHRNFWQNPGEGESSIVNSDIVEPLITGFFSRI